MRVILRPSPMKKPRRYRGALGRSREHSGRNPANNAIQFQQNNPLLSIGMIAAQYWAGRATALLRAKKAPLGVAGLETKGCISEHGARSCNSAFTSVGRRGITPARVDGKCRDPKGCRSGWIGRIRRGLPMCETTGLARWSGKGFLDDAHPSRLEGRKGE